MNWMLLGMTIALLMPVCRLCWDSFVLADSRRTGVWSKMLVFATISTKTSLLILVISVLRDDWMIGVVGVLILSVGNAALMLLAHALRRLNAAPLNFMDSLDRS
ncbi:MAG: hypothetical protein WBA76_05065 [Phormidesmis sp.]